VYDTRSIAEIGYRHHRLALQQRNALRGHDPLSQPRVQRGPIGQNAVAVRGHDWQAGSTGIVAGRLE
jgi:hypothetical protein